MTPKQDTTETIQADQEPRTEPVKEKPAAAGQGKPASPKKPKKAKKPRTIGQYMQEVEGADEETRKAMAAEMAGEISKHVDMNRVKATLDQATPAINEMVNRTAKALAAANTLYTDLAIQSFIESIGGTMRTISEAIKEQRQEEERFLQSERWAELQREFPDITEDDGKLLFWVGLTGQVMDNAAAIKRKIAEHEARTGEKLTFNDLLSIEDKDGNEITTVLLEEFLTEISKEAEETAQVVKLQSPGTPKNYIMPNTVFTNALRALDGKGEIIGAGPMLLPVLNKDKPSEVSILVNATLENMEGVKLTGKPYTEYDRAIGDAVCSLYVDRALKGLPPIATKADIYRTMTHKTSSEKLNPQQIGAVTKSIEKQRKNIYAEIDATEEVLKRKAEINGEPITSLKISDFLLSAKEITVEISGKKETAYLFSEPLQLIYARANGQLFTVPGSLLDIKKIDSKGHITTTSLSNTDNRISVKSYLLRRILIMISDEDKARDAYRKYENRRAKHPEMEPRNFSQFRKQSRTILFESIFTAAEITNKNQKTLQKDYVYTVLENWGTTNYKNTGRGFIKGFKKNRKRGKGIESVTIELW